MLYAIMNMPSNAVVIIYTLIFLFAVGSMLGWVLELFFRRIFTAKKWINPGFLTGPCLPLYGFGIASLYVMSSINLSSIGNKTVEDILIILIMTFVLTLLEYIAGLIFIKGMKIKLWDYSNRWGNIQGIICPLFTVFWLLACAAYYFFVNPSIMKMADWFQSNMTVLALFIGIFIGVFMIDFVNSMDLAKKIKKMAVEIQVIVKWEEFKENIADHMNELKQKRDLIKPFNSGVTLRESFEHYVNTSKQKLVELKEKYNQFKEDKNNKEDVKNGQ